MPIDLTMGMDPNMDKDMQMNADMDMEAVFKQSLNDHVIRIGQEINEKYGAGMDYDSLQAVLEERKFVRYPVEIKFDSSRIESGLFGLAEPEGYNAQKNDIELDEDAEYNKAPDQKFDIVLHENFKNHPEQLVPLILYLIPVVNYGDMAAYEYCEVFGAVSLGMDQDDYYQLLCDLTDSVWGKPDDR